jgi:cyclic pyranopterin phosphate synthase
MPKDLFGHNYTFLSRADVLAFEEIARIARVFVELGVSKIRLTGGEPLLRRELELLVKMLSSLAGIRDLTLTTNGSLLEKKAQSLRDAGLHRLTVSVDSVNPDTFAATNDVDFPLARVLAGIDAARAAGFSPIKINMVVKRGLNDDEIVQLARHFSGPQFVVRFIEYMDVGNSNGWRAEQVVPASEIVARLAAKMTLQPLPATYRGEVAQRFSTSGGGEIGIISSVSQPFCVDCTRARLSADGKLYTCLFASEGHDLRTPLRAGASDAQLARIISDIWVRREDRYSELRSAQSGSIHKAEMSLLGG